MSKLRSFRKLSRKQCSHLFCLTELRPELYQVFRTDETVRVLVTHVEHLFEFPHESQQMLLLTSKFFIHFFFSFCFLLPLSGCFTPTWRSTVPCFLLACVTRGARGCCWCCAREEEWCAVLVDRWRPGREEKQSSSYPSPTKCRKPLLLHLPLSLSSLFHLR